MLKFKESGNQFWYRLYDKLYVLLRKPNWIKKLKDKHADKVFEVLSYAFINYRALIVMYKIQGEKCMYEIVLQNDYKEEYQAYKETGDLARSINIEQLILNHHQYAFKIQQP